MPKIVIIAAWIIVIFFGLSLLVATWKVIEGK